MSRHVKEITEHGMGMYRYRGCRCEICSAAMREERRKYRPKSDNVNVKLDWSVMEDWLVKRGQLEFVDNTGLRRWRESGIPVYTADALCMRFGVHPAEVFGSEFYKGCFEQEFAA